MCFNYKSMVDNDMPGTWPVWTPGAPLAVFIKRSTIHCSIQNMNGFGEEDFFPIVSLWELLTPGVGPFDQGHDSQDLCKAPNNNAAYQI